MPYEVKPIENLNDFDVSELVDHSVDEGYRFLQRLVTDYADGSNRFDQKGEKLFGVWDGGNKLVAIGGLNRSPLHEEENIGRLRRFYILPEVRRQGVGSLLLKNLLQEAKGEFNEVNLRTDSAKADSFYRANGFVEVHDNPEVTHRVKL